MIFLNANGDLRSGWRFASYVVTFAILLLASVFAVSGAIAVANLVENDLARLAANAIALFVPAVVSVLFMARFVDHVPLAVLGVTLHERWWWDFILGVLLSSTMLLALVVVGLGVAQVDLTRSTQAGGFWPSFALTVAMLLVSAANEELMFRGYPLQVLMAGLGPWPAMMLMSVLFGAIHSSNPNFTWLGALNTFFAGMMLSVAYWKTRSLWLPYGIHATWNIGLGAILGFPLSGVGIASVWTTDLIGTDWITGGNYGPEGGLLATVLFLSAAGTILSCRRVDVSSSIRNALRENAGKVFF